MKIRILTITQKVPAWVQAGYLEYAKRLPASAAIEIIEIPAEKRTAQGDIQKILHREGEKIIALLKPTHHVIVLDIQGKLWSTEQLAARYQTWHDAGQTVDLIVGGPEGLSAACVAKAHDKWSLSPLTFPHFLVRIILAEQLYRAYTIFTHHPYHR